MPSCFGQIQFTIKQSVELRRGVAQVNTDHTVFSLAHSTAVLPLYAGSFVALFDKAGFVDGPDAVLVGVPTGDVLLQAIPHRSLVPAKQTKELLQVAWWFASSVRHGLDAFAWQIAQLALDVEIKTASGVCTVVLPTPPSLVVCPLVSISQKEAVKSILAVELAESQQKPKRAPETAILS